MHNYSALDLKNFGILDAGRLFAYGGWLLNRGGGTWRLVFRFNKLRKKCMSKHINHVFFFRSVQRMVLVKLIQ